MKKQLTSDLVQLIRSLTTAEKRSFSLASTRYHADPAKGKNYLGLYKQIDALTENDPIPKVQEDRADYLIELLTESLAHQRRHAIELELRHQLVVAGILYRRGLEKRAIRLYEKLYAQAREAGLHEFSLDIVSSQMQLITTVDQVDMLAVLIGRKNELLDILAKYRKLDDVLIRIFQALRSNQNANARKLLRLPILNKQLADRRSEIQRLYLLAHTNLSLEQLDACEKYHTRLIQLFEESPLYLSLRTHTYLIVVLNNGLLAYQTNNLQMVQQAIESLQKLPQRLSGLVVTIDQDRIIRYTLDLQLRYALLVKKPETVLKLIPEVKNCLLNDSKIEPYRINYLRYFVALSLVQLKRHREALPWLQSIVDEKRKGYYNQKTYGLAYLLRASCHFQLGNDDLAEPMLRSFRRTIFFEPLRKQPQFQELLKQLATQKDGGNWLL